MNGVNPELNSGPESDPIIFIMPVGLIPGLVMSYEKIRHLQEAEEERQRNKKNKPPKPPRRPNIPISGHVAIQNI